MEIELCQRQCLFVKHVLILENLVGSVFQKDSKGNIARIIIILSANSVQEVMECGGGGGGGQARRRLEGKVQRTQGSYSDSFTKENKIRTLFYALPGFLLHLLFFFFFLSHFFLCIISFVLWDRCLHNAYATLGGLFILFLGGGGDLSFWGVIYPFLVTSSFSSHPHPTPTRAHLITLSLILW